MVKFQIRSEGCRAVSPIRFFDPILNNALALRASQKTDLVITPILLSAELATLPAVQRRLSPRRWCTLFSLLREKSENFEK